jgi:ferrous iron transport protein B
LVAIEQVASGKLITKPHRIEYLSPRLKQAVADLTTKIEAEYPNLPNAGWVAVRLLDGDSHIRQALLRGELQDLEVRAMPSLAPEPAT